MPSSSTTPLVTSAQRRFGIQFPLNIKLVAESLSRQQAKHITCATILWRNGYLEPHLYLTCLCIYGSYSLALGWYIKSATQTNIYIL